jgi:hypothetical protein
MTILPSTLAKALRLEVTVSRIRIDGKESDDGSRYEDASENLRRNVRNYFNSFQEIFACSSFYSSSSIVVVVVVTAMLVVIYLLLLLIRPTQIVQDALDSQILGPGFTVVNEYCGLQIKVGHPSHARGILFFCRLLRSLWVIHLGTDTFHLSHRSFLVCQSMAHYWSQRER